MPCSSSRRRPTPIPNNADGYYNLGATYHRLGQLRNQPDSLARAETCYRQCLERNPNHRDCHRGLAVLLIEENRTTEAFTSIQTWATQSPSLAEPRMELARLYAEFGNKEAATNTLADAVRLNPNDARQWAALGKVREETGNYSQALANYQRSLEINPGQADVAARVTALQRRLGPAAAGASAAAGRHPAGRCRPAHARRAVRRSRGERDRWTGRTDEERFACRLRPFLHRSRPLLPGIAPAPTLCRMPFLRTGRYDHGHELPCPLLVLSSQTALPLVGRAGRLDDSPGGRKPRRGRPAGRKMSCWWSTRGAPIRCALPITTPSCGTFRPAIFSSSTGIPSKRLPTSTRFARRFCFPCFGPRNGRFRPADSRPADRLRGLLQRLPLGHSH